MNEFLKDFLVFVVDDDPHLDSSLVRILLLKGFPARCFSNPLDALDAARKESPDALLVDLKLPGMSGVELAFQMLAVLPDCRVLLLTADAEDSRTLATARSLGFQCDTFLRPVSSVRLVDRVHAYYLDKKLKAKRMSRS